MLINYNLGNRAVFSGGVVIGAVLSFIHPFLAIAVGLGLLIMDVRSRGYDPKKAEVIDVKSVIK